jgi:hypothetical protein
MKNKNLILLLAAGAAYWYFFMYKKKQPVQTSQFFKNMPGDMIPLQTLEKTTVRTESLPFPQSKESQEGITFMEQIQNFGFPDRQLEYNQDEVFQTYYANQVNGVKRVGVPYTI